MRIRERRVINRSTGHIGIAFAVKPRAPKTPLSIVLIAGTISPLLSTQDQGDTLILVFLGGSDPGKSLGLFG